MQRISFSIADGVVLGGDAFVVMAGPCAVESRGQLLAVAEAVAAAGAGVLRGGAFKPRTSPKSFQGLGVEGLSLLREAAVATGLPVVTEVLDPRDVDLVGETAAMLQVGSRNMQNFPLLREVGRRGLPVLLKRGAAATLDELVQAAEYVLQEGNERVALCERGVRGFDPCLRNLLDLPGALLARRLGGFQTLVDPSHGTGVAGLVAPMALAARAAGLDGALVEAHVSPKDSLSDGDQALRPEELEELVRALAPAERADEVLGTR